MNVAYAEARVLKIHYDYGKIFKVRFIGRFLGLVAWKGIDSNLKWSHLQWKQIHPHFFLAGIQSLGVLD